MAIPTGRRQHEDARRTRRSIASPEATMAEVRGGGWAVLPGFVPPDAVQDALRHLHLDLVRQAPDAETLGAWIWSAHWFPHLRWDPPILGLLEHLPDWAREGDPCDPQIILQPPDDCEPEPLVSHVDQEPEWAAGRRYRLIVGIALSPAHATNGGLVVWPFDDEPRALELEPGDVVLMNPDLPHASGYNLEGAIRYAVYFRFLEPATAA